MQILQLSGERLASYDSYGKARRGNLDLEGLNKFKDLYFIPSKLMRQITLFIA